MTNYSAEAADPLTLAHMLINKAEGHGDDARASRQVGDHQRAGKDREEERSSMKRAEVLALVSIARSLETLADEAQRVALGR